MYTCRDFRPFPAQLPEEPALFPWKQPPKRLQKVFFCPKMNIPALKMIFKMLPVAFPVVYRWSYGDLPGYTAGFFVVILRPHPACIRRETASPGLFKGVSGLNYTISHFISVFFPKATVTQTPIKPLCLRLKAFMGMVIELEGTPEWGSVRCDRTPVMFKETIR